MNNTVKVIVVGVIFSMSALLGACSNTLAGVGKDMQESGKALTQSVESDKNK